MLFYLFLPLSLAFLISLSVIFVLDIITNSGVESPLVIDCLSA